MNGRFFLANKKSKKVIGDKEIRVEEINGLLNILRLMVLVTMFIFKAIVLVSSSIKGESMEESGIEITFH